MVGRRPGVALAPDAERALTALRSRFASERLEAVHASPVERAQRTAAAIAEAAGRAVETASDLDEVELGEWTGRRLDEMAHDPAFQLWCRDRAQARAPGGESLLEVRLRMVRHAEAARARGPRGAWHW